MGLLSEGNPLSWTEIKLALQQIRTYGLDQLVHIFNKYKDRQKDPFLWGDETELTLVRFDHKNKTVRLLLKSHQLLPILNELNKKTDDKEYRITWHPEGCDFVMEGIPFQPYGSSSSYFNTVEANMRQRREQAQRILCEQTDCDYILSIAVFPRYGQGQYTYPPIEYGLPYSVEKSLCYPDSLLSPHHPRSKSLSTNISERRQSKVSVNIPIFKDSRTPSPFRDELFKDDPDIKDDHIHLDSSLAGLGCSCLQVTFQGESIKEAIHLYDQLLPLCPIMLCLSAACPIWRGYLSDIDCRWNILCEAIDARTAEEKKQTGFPSRYALAPLYLADKNKHLNDIDYSIDEYIITNLIDQGMPETLSRHYGHLFIHDPLVVLEESLHTVDDTTSYHFENINSHVWNSLRLKPPPLNDTLTGWRVEFRPMDIQISDFENAALVVFVALLTRVIITYDLDLTIPISQVDENMDIAHYRDSVRREKFYFRYGTYTSQIFMNEIINGNKDFPGLVSLVRKYVHEREDMDENTRHTIEQYLLLISKRADGTLLTNASWIREFVLSHSSYKQDSVISEEIQYDLIWKMVQITNEHKKLPTN
ncbi:unnamed protein product [Rotaria sordida]|uniref:Glutamate--cysteine ligase n=1 Tax=Rotaria sordida TaxID=392033 RepID=A0A815PKK1_9BILA|nr:unnamed protein product [Rotaria sordida]CAF1450454.1 unnamed protein product [Rotaria sordida]